MLKPVTLVLFRVLVLGLDRLCFQAFSPLLFLFVTQVTGFYTEDEQTALYVCCMYSQNHFLLFCVCF